MTVYPQRQWVAYGTEMRIQDSAITRAQRAVESELAARDPALSSQYTSCLLTARRDIENRLRITVRNEGIEAHELDDSVQERLADCVTNHALGILGAQHRAEQLRTQASRAGVTTALGWARRCREIDATFSTLAFFEQWVTDGHPLHPAAKVRLGLSPAEVVDTCPEWGNIIALRVAVLGTRHAAEFGITETDDLRVQRPGALTRLLLREHPQLGRELADGGDDPDHLTLLPLHPWQAAHILGTDYAAELRGGAIRQLRAQIPARPLISYRTVAPLPTSAAAWPSHLKTSLSVRLTNAPRGVSPAAAHNGPVVSRLLEQILGRERHFGGRLHVMSETAAGHFEPTGHEIPRPGELGRDAALAALARSNPEAELSPDELLVPTAALWSRSPITGRPVVAELLEHVQQRLNSTHRSGPHGAGAERFVQRYAQVCLPPLLTLLTRYGVALEAHGENTVLAIRGGLPVRCIVRDFGGIRIHPGRLARAGLDVQLRSGRDIVTADADQLRNKLYFALFVNDLSQLMKCLSHCSGQPQASLWRHFGSVAHATFADLATDPVLVDDATADAAALLERPWPNKALLTMWLRGDVTEDTYFPTTNPLIGPDPGVDDVSARSLWPSQGP